MGRTEILRSLAEGLAVFAVVALGFWIGLQQARRHAPTRARWPSAGCCSGTWVSSSPTGRTPADCATRSRCRTLRSGRWSEERWASSALVLLLPPLRRVFQFGPLHLDDLAISAGLTVALVAGLVLTGRLGAPAARRQA